LTTKPSRIAGSDRQPCRTPLRESILEPACLETAFAKRRHCFVGQYAVWSAAIRNDLGRLLEFGQLRFKRSQRNVHRAGQVSQFVGLDPSPHLLNLVRTRAAEVGLPVEFVLGSATAIPLADASIDTVVMTWTLCSIPDPLAALREMRRVLKPDGNLLFVEHGHSPEPNIERWQRRITPIWRRVAGGCHLDRKIDELIRRAGFNLANVQADYAPGPRPMSFMYQGCACRDGGPV
jgi:SAM-dependent methyltransferase